jgi:CHAT domain-containing protein
MELENLLRAVQELVNANTPQEAQSVVLRYPELLEEESIQTLRRVAELSRSAGEAGMAEALEWAAGLLLQLRQAVTETPSSGGERMTASPVSPESSVPWARLTRQYLALRKDEFLEQAIAEAQRTGETEIVALLHAWQQGDFQTIQEQAQELHGKFLEAGRNEEAWTVALVGLDQLAALAELFIQFPLEQQLPALEAGLRACQEAAAIAQALGDEACEAFYKGVAANGYARSRRLEGAQAAYEEGLALYRKLAQRQPQVYEPSVATTLNNLGTVLRDLRRLEEAQAAYEEGLALHRRYDIPDQRAVLLSGLGGLGMEQEQWHEAAEALQEAVEAVERLRTEALSLDRRMQILRENIHIYERLLVCLMKLRRYQQALEVAERGKSRTLIDLLTLRDLRPKNAPPEVVHEYERMLFRARALEDQLQRGDGPDAGAETLPPEERAARRLRQMEEMRRELVQTQSRLRQLVDVIRQHDADFLPTAKSLTVEEITVLAKEANATLALFRVTEAGSFVFLVFPDGETDVVQVPEFTTKALTEMLVKFEGDKPVDGWVVRYYAYQEAMASRNIAMARQAQQAWWNTMDATLGQLYERLLKPVHQRLRDRRRETGDRLMKLVVVPNRGLAVLPLHACWWNENGERRYLLDEDEFVITYAPSLSVFKRCLERERAGREKETLLGIANPVPPGNLVFSEWECAEIERLLGHERCLILWREKATAEELMRWVGQRHWLHFSCHGQYRLDAPLESSLLLANGETLTLGEILERLDLRQAWLTVLSACETGLVDFREIADEHYGLPLGFLFAGAPTVWGTLWTVNDLTTALLMVKAYEGLIREGKGKPEALRDAQLWLRDATAGELSAVLLQKEAELGRDRMAWTDLAPLTREMRFSRDPTECPFAHPYFWAGMQCVGV